MELEQEPPFVTVGATLLRSDFDFPLALTVDFTYLPADPMAVSMTMRWETELPNGELVSDVQTWTFGRDLIDQALSVPDATHGGGDVRTCFLSDRGVLRFTLIDIQRMPSELYLEAAPVATFVRAMYALVPPGQERIDIDAMLRQLEGEAL